ncbi:hypothetical protein [Indioceanicola profundi]|uniref:hypothetical protein n=1 Tax=Indioceanicola profundi TaxID=2220096 RepID=UPI000E6ACA2F|nr:hypothetical protein [Indioceanicola profundi]
MPRRPISSRTHGWLDYASAIALVAAPRLLGWDKKVRRLTDAAAVGTLAYAHLTDYEVGAYPALSMKQHLAVDLLEGATFLSAAYMLEDEPPAVRWALAGYGLFALAAGSLTETHSSPGHGSRHIGGGRRTSHGAWVMDDTLEETEHTMHLKSDQTPHTGGRVAESEWRQSRDSNYDRSLRAKSDLGRNANAHAQTGAVGTSEWRRSTEHRRHDMAMAGSGSHENSGTWGKLDARRGYRDGQGI